MYIPREGPVLILPSVWVWIDTVCKLCDCLLCTYTSNYYITQRCVYCYIVPREGRGVSLTGVFIRRDVAQFEKWNMDNNACVYADVPYNLKPKGVFVHGSGTKERNTQDD